MIFATVNKIPAFILKKLDILFNLLNERKWEYEELASKLDDKQLKRSVLELAQETNQYAIELCSQIKTMGGHIALIQESDFGGNKTLLVPVEEHIMQSCEVSEKRMIGAYRNILNEPFLHENLRKLIRCQLNGLTYAFMQLKLLNTSFHR